MTDTYAHHASEAFNASLHQTLNRLARDVKQALKDNLVALVLGGGYGRGEGGVVCKNDREHPYNDLDLTLVVKQKRAVKWDALKNISNTYESATGIEVDFSRPLTISDIQHWPHRLMWYDLLQGHKVLAGSDNILTTHAPPTLYHPLPPIEATRLLLNRGAGLLWAMRVAKAVESPPDEDFVRRNYYKCALALGDALLITHKCFTTAYRGRDRLLAKLGDQSKEVRAMQLEALYEEALRFKFRPNEVAPEAPEEAQLRSLAQKFGAIYLHTEQMRTGHPWQTLDHYVAWKGIREPEENTISKWPRNIVQNRRLGMWSYRYPREVLYRQLPVLLGLTNTPVFNWTDKTSSFLKRWDRFN